MSEIAINTVLNVKKAIENAISLISEKSFQGEKCADFVVSMPADKAHGDLASNAAMTNARVFKRPPLILAKAIIENIDLSQTPVSHCEIAGKGFINFFFSPQYYADILNEILQKQENYGKSDFGGSRKVMVEFVSANPTGPMHMGNARGGALGDCLAAVMESAGYDVWREFYLNDAGNQIEKFGSSLEARYLQIYLGGQVVFPEDGYQGSDITEHAKNYAEQFGDVLVKASEEERKRILIEFSLPKNIQKMQADMDIYKIHFDKWFYESWLHDQGKVKEAIEILKKKGLTYEKDGAVWYKNAEVLKTYLLETGKSETEIADLNLKDDVLVRQNGNPTYFAADIAYHKNKFDRGCGTLIDIWGADHHGHVMRLKGAIRAIDYPDERFHVILMQMVRLISGGEVVKMSKRTGKAIQLCDLLSEVPVDSARFLFNTKEANTQMDFDLDLAIQTDNQNPVYYVQYAHARICSIIKNIEESGISVKHCTNNELLLLTEPEERDLITHLGAYTGEIISAACELDPTKITRYVTHLSTLFHKFYNSCRVKVEREALLQARVNLCLAVKIVIKNILTMFKISCPDMM